MLPKRTLFIIYLLIFYSFETAQCQWYPETCDVDGGMNSISMWNNTTGWIAGDGRICKYDGNGHWDLINTLSWVDYLVFTDSLNGWANGYHGIYKTSNGGYSWIQVFENINLLGTSDISAVDPLHCWVINIYEDYYGNTVYVLEFTDDGGITWKYPQNDFQAYLVFFKDLNHGWRIRRHQTLLTNDGGNNWQIYSDTTLGYSYLTCDFYFIDTIRGWKIGGFPGHVNTFISSTIDGGKNWSIQYQGNATDWYDGIYFPDSLYGYVAGYRGDGDSVLILKTKDGGLTWEEQIYLAINAGLSRKIFFTDSITGWIVGGWREGQLILHTENSGIGTGGISDQTKMIDGGLTLKVSPNPCTNQTELSIGTGSERMLALDLYSFNGDKKTIFRDKYYPFGKNTFTLNTESLISGIYLITLSGDGVSVNSKLVVVR